MKSIEHLANYRVFGDCSTGDTYTPEQCAPLFDKLAAKGVWETAYDGVFPNASRCFLRSSIAAFRIRQRLRVAADARQQALERIVSRHLRTAGK